MDATVIVSLIVAVVGIAITIVIWLASTRAVRVQEAQAVSPVEYLRHPDEGAFDRASKIYERTIDQLEAEVVRLTERLETETERHEIKVREFQAEIARLNLELGTMRSQVRETRLDNA